MTPLTFTLTRRPDNELDMSLLSPCKLTGLNRKEISSLKLECGKQKLPVTHFFKVTGRDSNNIIIRGSCNRLIRIGNKMSQGKIEVYGHAGNELGKDMTNGEIIVNGNAADWVGCNMNGGKIFINGNAGNFLGSAPAEHTHGMSNGLIFVSGNAADRVGDRLRRGIIIIKGDCGEYCGSRMIAGTIIVLGSIANHIGFSMKRGTIILARKPRNLSATFISCGYLKMEFLRLLFKQLASSSRKLSFFKQLGPLAYRFAGDHACSGKGEILVLQ